jgi:flagellar biosynthesis/type III secretory pathway protein FliH
MSEGTEKGLAAMLASMRPRVPEPVPVVDIEGVRAAAFAEGEAAGAARAEAELAPLRLALAEAAAALRAAAVIDVDALRPVLAGVIKGICETVVMAELRLDPSVLLRLIEAALAMVRPGEVATLRAHPVMLERLRPYLPEMEVAADAALAGDEFAVSGGDFVIEAGLAARLGEIMEGVA